MPPAPLIDMQAMQEAAQTACSLLRTIANENRLLLMCQLSQGEKSVGELEEILGIRQPTLSQQLGILRNKGLVATRRDGKQIIYSVCDPKAMQVLGTLYGLYCPLPANRS